MVRFSDMLGGSGEPDDAAAAESPYAALANEAGDPDADALDADTDDTPDAAKEPVPMATFESPEAVLNRLTQYATSARVIETAEPEIVEPEAVEPEAVEPEAVEPEAVEPEAVEPEAAEAEVPTEAVAPEAVNPEPEPEVVEPEVVEPEPEPVPEEPLRPVGDDFLPTVRGIARRAGRGRKRHP
jgi:hypothetical protein